MSALWRLSIVAVLLGAPTIKGFDYAHPEEWGNEAPTCNGQRQSPIDLREDLPANDPVVDKPLKWNNYGNLPNTMTILNNGHTIKLTPKWTNEKDVPYLSGGPLKGEYALLQIHFHWGASSDVGSEHQLRGKAFSLECHMVHINKAYPTAKQALENEDGLAVVGSFYDVNNDEDGSGVMEIVTELALDVSEDQSEKDVEPFQIDKFDVVKSKHPFITYPGSLTTPGCNEVVTWIVATTTYPMMESALEIFRSMELQHQDDHNYRPVQPLNDRKITVYM